MAVNRLWWVLWLGMWAACATDDPGDLTDERQDPNACTNPCGPGETRCNGSVIEACAADASGCFDWVGGVDCAADGTQCDDSAEPALCLSEPGTCQDNALNQDESDVDCGGQRCVPCNLGDRCNAGSDCSTGNCDVNGTDECVPEDQETCGDGRLNRDETDVDCGGGCPSCEEGQACVADGDCASGSCDAGACAPAAGPCNDGEVQCAGNTVQTCTARQWVETQICAQGCDAGACADDVQCTPAESRCYRNSVQVCNAQGSAWQHLDICSDRCDAGLCAGACDPGAFRCNGDVQETCSPDGQSWATADNCALGCAQRVCVEDKLDNMGVPMTMTGTHVYDGCVRVQLGGTITVPAGETLEVWAKCLEVSSSSFITLDTGARFIFHASETIVNDGAISGGDFVRLDAYRSLTNSGDVSSQHVELRGDVLTNAAGATIGGSLAYALYGSQWENQGTHTGDDSVMPPERLSSPTHPEGFQWNMTQDDVSIAWDKPFASVRGYYVSVNAAEVPSPSNAEFTTVENVTLPLAMFRPGTNTVQVVTVNADSTVGTVPARFEVDFNVSSPTVSSDSHSDPFEWSSSDDVFLTWTEASSVDPGSFVGYWYAWDHRGDTQPSQATGTFRNDDKILFDNQAPGVWMFHISSIDRLGRTSPVPGRYEVRVGPEPGFGNVAGSISDAQGAPVRGASVTLNGGVYRATSVASGDYTFRGEVPAAAFDWEVTVAAPGYVPQTQTVRMQPDGVQLVDFQLQRDNRPAAYELGFAVFLDSTSSYSGETELDVALGRPGEVIWSNPSRAKISSTTGTVLRNVSASAASNERVEVGFDGGHYFAATPRYASGYYPVHLQLFDATHGVVMGRSLTSWPTMYGPSVAWDGSRFVVVGGYDYLQLGAVDPNDPDNVGDAADLSATAGSSYTRTKAVFDGSAVAVATVGYYSSDYTVSLGRWTRDGAEVLAPVRLPTPVRYGQPVGLAWDGERYHLSFRGATAKPNGKYPLYIQSVSQTGVVGSLTELDDVSSSGGAPMVAFDGRNLLVVYAVDGEGVLEVRQPADHRLVDTLPLGNDISNLNIDFAFHAGRGMLIYADQGLWPGTYMREVRVR